MSRRTYREPLPEERDALEAFAAAHGRSWRRTLTELYWPNARIWSGTADTSPNVGSILHGIRNDLGPDWLLNVYKPRRT